MIKYLTKYAFILGIIWVTSCGPTPKVVIPNTLEISLKDGYSNYVNIMNNSIDGDEKALMGFLKLDGFFDGASYDHGWVLLEVMKKVGDKRFSDAISNLRKDQIKQLKTYFNAGCDGSVNVDSLYETYPLSFKLLGYTKAGGVPFQ